MKYRSVPRITAFVPLFCAIEGTPQEGLEALVSGFYREYSDIQLLNARRFIQYFSEDTCQKEDGYVDFENKVMPLLSCMDSRFKPTRNITAAAWDVDLSAVQKQFQRLIDTNFFHKDTLAHGSADNPMLKQAGINSKKERNLCLMTLDLTIYYSRFSRTNNFFVFLRDVIIDDFRVLGVDGDSLVRIVRKINEAFVSLKAASEKLQTVTDIKNKNLSYNIGTLVGIPKHHQDILSNTKSHLPYYKCTESASSDILLDNAGLCILVDSLDYMYLTEHVPAILELFCSCFYFWS